jgi:hypothetical protein
MTDLLNLILALVSIGLGAIGWIAPRYTLAVLDLRPGESTMGLSEMRAASGALFVGLGAGALVIGTPEAHLMAGIAWAFAAAGRLTSVLFDARPTARTGAFLAVEAAVAALWIGINL